MRAFAFHCWVLKASARRSVWSRGGSLGLTACCRTAGAPTAGLMNCWCRAKILPSGVFGRGSAGRRSMYWKSGRRRSEEHTSELQSLMRISYAVFCLKKKKLQNKQIISITRLLSIKLEVKHMKTYNITQNHS